MKFKPVTIIVLLSAVLLSACAPAAAPAAEVLTGDTANAVPVETASVNNESVAAETTTLTADMLDITFDDAANIRSQLAYGLMKLEGTANAVTSEQAASLVPLWQAVLLLSTDSMTASEELTAVQDQIAQALTLEQFQAIADMKITNTVLSAYYAEMGIVMSTPAPGVVPGSKKNMSEEDKQATRAANAAAGISSGNGQSARTLLIEKVIEYLTSIS